MSKMPRARHKNIVWNPRQVTQLLTLFKRHPNLYDMKDPYYDDQGRRSFALAKILLALRRTLPQLSEEDVVNKFGSLRGKYVSLTQQLHKPGLRVPYWYPFMEFYRPQLGSLSPPESLQVSPVSVAKRHKSINVENLSIDLDANLMYDLSDGMTGAPARAGAGAADNRSASDDSSENGESDASKLDPHHGRSPAQAILDTATTMLGRLADRVSYAADVEAFGEMVKAEMQSLQPQSRRHMRNKIMAVIINEGKCLEYL